MLIVRVTGLTSVKLLKSLETPVQLAIPWVLFKGKFVLREKLFISLLAIISYRLT